MTANATMKVTNGTPNALLTYSAAPAARGYFVTSSASATAVKNASTIATRNDAQIAPPTRSPIVPTSA